MANYIPNGRQQFCDANGTPLALGTVGMYVVGTLTPLNTWQDASQTTLNANPVPLDAGGFAMIYGTGQYRQIVKDYLGNVVWDRVANAADGGAVQSSGSPFTGSAYYSYALRAANGATPGTWYSALQGGTNATEAGTYAITVPASATNHQTNALAGYIRSDRAQLANGGEVAGYFQGISNATNAAVFGFNAVTADTVGFTGQKLDNEIDVNVVVGDTTATGLNVVLSDSIGGSGSRNAVRLDKAGTNGWLNGYLTADGSISASGYALFVGSQTTTTSTNRDSQKAAFTSYDTSNNRYIATIFGDHTGGIALRPGASGGSVAFQSPDGSQNWGSVSVNGIGYPVGAGGAVTQATSRTTAVTINKVSGAITLVSAAGSASWQTFTVNNSMVAATDTIRVSQQSGTDKNQIHVSRTAAGAFDITFATTGGTTTEQPVFNFTILKGVNS